MKKMIYNVLNEMAEYLTMFLDAKKIEGCSDRTIVFYKSKLI